MSLLVALFLGLIQGLTEFLPVSSSAHLKLTEMLFGLHEVPVIFALSCHLGTLGAMIVFFKQEIVRLFKHDRIKIAYFVVALFPLVPSYFLLANIREAASNPQFLGLCLMVTAGILFFGSRIRFKKKRGLMHDVLLIGVMQSAALIPGISRSASTISCAQALGWKPKEAVRFSFMLAIPTIVGANMVEMMKLWKTGKMSFLLNTECLIGFTTSFLVGIGVIRFAIRFLEKGNLQPFAWYCLGIGLLATAYLLGIL